MSNLTCAEQIIFFRRLNLHGFRQSCGYLNLNCGLRSLNSNHGFRYCNCCLSYGLSLKMSFSKERHCFCWKNCLRGLNCYFCYSCRWSFFCSSQRKDVMKMSSTDAHILSWSATDGYCWVRCSFGVHRFGCQGGQLPFWQDVVERSCCLRWVCRSSWDDSCCLNCYLCEPRMSRPMLVDDPTCFRCGRCWARRGSLSRWSCRV